MTDIYLHIDARMADYMDTHPYNRHHHLHLLRSVAAQVELPGGPLTILWDQTGSGKIFMTGAAALAFHGTFTV